MKIQKTVFSHVLITLITILIASISYAGSTIRVEKDVPYSDLSGIPANVTFNIYDAEVAGALIESETFPGGTWWSDYDFTQYKTAVVNIVRFKADFTNTAALSIGTELWLEIDLDGTVYGSREQIKQEAWALFSEEAVYAYNADTVDGIDSADLEESAEIDSDITTHAGVSGVHHTKTTSFAELTDQASNSQIPIPLDLSGTGPVIKGTDSGSGNYGYFGGSSFGVYGNSNSNYGVYGKQNVSGNSGYLGGNSFGVYGRHNSGNYGALGSADSGVRGKAATRSYGVYGESSSGNYGYLGGSSYGAYGYSSTAYGVYGRADNGAAGVRGIHSSTGNNGILGSSYDGVWGYTSTANGHAVRGYNDASGNKGHIGGSDYGVRGYNFSGNYGYLGSNVDGVYGYSRVSTGVYGRADCCADGQEWGADYGVFGDHWPSSNNGSLGSAFEGVYGYGYSDPAGFFSGDVIVNGTLTKTSGAFKIDHPLDPANKYLYHSFVESPDMKNIYDGVVVLDKNGDAWVEMEEWFEALNSDFRYQLTAIGAPGPSLYIDKEISDNRFKIAGGTSGMKVSWQVTGIRQDPYAKAYRIPVEEGKPKKEQGYYLHPGVYSQPEEKSIEWARSPKRMNRLKEEREGLKRKPGM